MNECNKIKIRIYKLFFNSSDICHSFRKILHFYDSSAEKLKKAAQKIRRR
jgi:hypothetical protein